MRLPGGYAELVDLVARKNRRAAICVRGWMPLSPVKSLWIKLMSSTLYEVYDSHSFLEFKEDLTTSSFYGRQRILVNRNCHRIDLTVLGPCGGTMGEYIESLTGFEQPQSEIY